MGFAKARPQRDLHIAVSTQRKIAATQQVPWSGVMNAELLQHLSTPVVLITRHLRIEWMNQAAEALLETSSARSRGESIDYLLRRIDAQDAHLIEVEDEDLRTTTVRGARVRLLSSTEINLDYTITPWSPDSAAQSQDRHQGFVVELHPLDPTTHLSRDHAQSSHLEATRHLLKGLAHEIKNPLGGLRGAAQLLQAELASQPLREYTRVIIDEADRLKDLVDRLLLPKTQPRMALMNIHRALERVLHLLRAEFRNIEVRRDYDPSLPEIMGDEGQLIQATLNIAQNAAQVLQERGTHGDQPPLVQLRTRVLRQVTLGSRRHRLAIKIDIIDNGPGISSTMADRVFVPFTTDRAKGTGLGLAIASDIALQHQGSLECSSVPGETRFTLLLPIEQNPPPGLANDSYRWRDNQGGQRD